MKQIPAKLPMEIIREALLLDETSPTWLRWKERPLWHFKNEKGWRANNARSAGKQAGGLYYSPKDGCFIGLICLGARTYRLARVVFALSNDYDPGDFEVDHIDADTENNNPQNLRLASRSQNGMNCRSRGASSGHTGVCWDKKKKKWRSVITANGKTIFLGHFDKKEEAIVARLDAERRYHGEYAFSARPSQKINSDSTLKP